MLYNYLNHSNITELYTCSVLVTHTTSDGRARNSHVNSKYTGNVLFRVYPMHLATITLNWAVHAIHEPRSICCKAPIKKQKSLGLHLGSSTHQHSLCPIITGSDTQQKIHSLTPRQRCAWDSLAAVHNAVLSSSASVVFWS